MGGGWEAGRRGEESNPATHLSTCAPEWCICCPQVIGSDLVYVAAASVILAGVIDRLLRSGTKRVIYAHTRGRLPAADTFWLQQIEAHGKCC